MSQLNSYDFVYETDVLPTEKDESLGKQLMEAAKRLKTLFLIDHSIGD